ncbi:MAG: class I SAM-dependent methyltransferase [Candidatus Bathyarchaeia archaeon]
METHKREVEARFSGMAEGYDRWFQTPIGRYVDHHEREAVVSLLDPRPGELILDIGTGTGVYLMEAARRGATVVGLDISLNMLRVLSRKLREEERRMEASLVLGDAENLPFREKAFQKAVSNTTLEFIPNPEKALGEARRTLRFGGSLVIGVLTSTSLWALGRRFRKLRSGNVYSYSRFYSLRRLRRVLKSSGLIVEEARWAVYAPRGTLGFLIPVYERLEGWLSSLPLLRSLGAFLAVKAVPSN